MTTLDQTKRVRVTALWLAGCHRDTESRYKDVTGTIESVYNDVAKVYWPKLGCSSIWALEALENVE